MFHLPRRQTEVLAPAAPTASAPKLTDIQKRAAQALVQPGVRQELARLGHQMKHDPIVGCADRFTCNGCGAHYRPSQDQQDAALTLACEVAALVDYSGHYGFSRA